MKSFEELYRSRRSCRAFDGSPVSEDVLARIIEAGRFAPSACNTQPWHFYVARGDSLPSAKALLNPKFSGAGAVIFVAERATPLPFSPENPFRQIDIGLAVMQMVLAAETEGISTCIIGSFDKEGTGKYLSLPENECARIAIALGKPMDEGAFLPKNRLAEVETVTLL